MSCHVTPSDLQHSLFDLLSSNGGGVGVVSVLLDDLMEKLLEGEG